MVWCVCGAFFFFSSRRRHTRCSRDWSSDVCSSDLRVPGAQAPAISDSIIGGQLRSEGLAVLSVADDEGVGCGRVELFHTAEPMVTAVERRHRESNGPLLVAESQLVGQLFF